MSKTRRTHSAEFQTQGVLAYLSDEKTVAELWREHQLKDTRVYRWKDEFLARASPVFEPEKWETSEAAERWAGDRPHGAANRDGDRVTHRAD